MVVLARPTQGSLRVMDYIFIKCQNDSGRKIDQLELLFVGVE